MPQVVRNACHILYKCPNVTNYGYERCAFICMLKTDDNLFCRAFVLASKCFGDVNLPTDEWSNVFGVSLVFTTFILLIV